MVVRKFQLDDWKVKEGFFLRPEEADRAEEDWETFDSRLMHWYGAGPPLLVPNRIYGTGRV